MYRLPKGTRLYRAVVNFDELFQPHLCQDTGKTGCYFSCNDPFLADSMALEYRRPLFRAEFKVKEEIKCSVGKYAFRKLPPGKQNVNHIDFEIGALTLDDDPSRKYAEVFLTQNELYKLEMMDFVVITPQAMAIKYAKFIRPN